MSGGIVARWCIALSRYHRRYRSLPKNPFITVLCVVKNSRISIISQKQTKSEYRQASPQIQNKMAM